MDSKMESLSVIKITNQSDLHSKVAIEYQKQFFVLAQLDKPALIGHS